MDIPTREVIENRIMEACEHLYANGKHLLAEKAHERNIVARFLLPPLVELFPDWDVDPEYNREGEVEDRQAKTDDEGNRLLPDLIIHKYGPAGPNLVAIEVKGYWNPENRKEDEESLRRIQKKHGYIFLYRLELNRESYELIPVI